MMVKKLINKLIEDHYKKALCIESLKQYHIGDEIKLRYPFYNCIIKSIDYRNRTITVENARLCRTIRIEDIIFKYSLY